MHPDARDRRPALARRRRAWRAGAVAAVLALVGVSVITSKAATLEVRSATVDVHTVTHPCPGPVTARPTGVSGNGMQYASVTLTLPSACSERTLQVAVTDGTTTLQGAATVDADGSAVVGLDSSFDGTSRWAVAAVVDGWPLTVDYTPAAPPYWCTPATGTGSCTVTVTPRTGDNGVRYYDAVVTTTSSSAVRWEVTFDFGHPFYGGQPTYLGNSDLDEYDDGQTYWYWKLFGIPLGPPNDVTRVSACSELPHVRVQGQNTGPTSNRFRDVRSNRPRQFSLAVDVTDQVEYRDLLAPGCG